jgi:hypothetical protein
MKLNQLLGLLLTVIILSACSSFGTLGIVTKTSIDPASVLKSGRGYKEIGPAEGKACRYFLLAIIPWGDSTFSTAVDRALSANGGDALINVSVESSLWGWIPIYNVFSWTCTTAKGIAVKFEEAPKPPSAPASE